MNCKERREGGGWRVYTEGCSSKKTIIKCSCVIQQSKGSTCFFTMSILYCKLCKEIQYKVNCLLLQFSTYGYCIYIFNLEAIKFIWLKESLLQWFLLPLTEVKHKIYLHIQSILWTYNICIYFPLVMMQINICIMILHLGCVRWAELMAIACTQHVLAREEENSMYIVCIMYVVCIYM